VRVDYVVVDSIVRFVVDAEYYVEFTIVVVGAMSLAVVCCDVSGMQLVQAMRGH
jgi:hypothetical protein